MLHHEQKAFEDRGRLTCKSVLALDVQQLTAHLEALVQRARLGVRPRREPRLQVLQEDGVKLRHAFCRLVVTLHHRFARAPVGAVGEAHLLGERRLHVEHQAILAPSGEVMQADAQILQHRFVPREAARLGALDESRGHETDPAAAEARGARDPLDDLQVA